MRASIRLTLSASSLALGISLTTAPSALGQPLEADRNKPRPLRVGARTTDTPIAGGAVLVYSLKLKANQFCAIRIRQGSIDLVATLVGPDTTPAADVDTPHRTTGDEVVEVVAEKTGTYVLTIRPKEPDAPPGAFRIRIDQIRRASDADRRRVKALRMFERGERLRGEGTAESLRAAQTELEHALTIFRENNDRRGEAVAVLRSADILKMMGYLTRAPAKYREALELYRALKDTAGVAESLSGEGSSHETAIRLSRLEKDPGLVGRALLNYAASVYWGRRYTEHKLLVDEAVEVFRAINDRRGLALAIRGEGMAVQEAQSPSDALPLFREMLSLARSVGDLHIEALAHGSIAWASTYLGRMQDVINAYSEGVDAAQRAGALLTEAWQTRSLGQAYAQVGDVTRALTYYAQALPLEREVDVRMDHGVTLGSMAQAYAALGDHAKALDYSKQSVAVFQEIGDRQEEGVALLILGVAYDNLGRTDEALEHYIRSRQVLQELKDRRREGWVLARLGGFYADRGDYQLALEVSQLAVDASRSFEDGTGQVRAIARVANVYRLLGQPQRAAESYDQGLVVARHNGLKTDEAITLVRLGHTFSDQGDYERARQHFEEALSLARAKDMTVPSVEAAALEGLAGTRRAIGEVGGAISAYREALEIGRRIADSGRLAEALNGLGQALAASGDTQGALTAFVEVLQLARANRLTAAETLALGNLMSAWRLAGRPAVATFYGKQAVNLLQTIRTNILQLEPQTQRAFIRSKEQVYRELADLLIGQGRLPEAQQVLDFLKEVELREYVRRSGAVETQKIDLTPDERVWEQRYLEIADRVVALGRERSALEARKLRTPEDDAQLAKLDADLAVAGRKFTSFVESLAAELGSPRDAGERAFQLREAEGLTSTLRELGDGSVVLYTVVTERRYAVMIITPDVQKAAEFSISSADLSRKIQMFREALQNPRSDPLPLAKELYTILVGPIARDLQQARARTLMWSLDGVLRYVPISALHDGTGYLVERYRTMLFTPASRDRLKDRSGAWRNGLGLGVSKPLPGFDPLPAVAEELRSIFRDSAQPGGDNGMLPGRVLLDEAFTEPALRESLRRRPPVVHIASHFQFRPGSEEDSFLLLGDGRRLTVADLSAEFTIFSDVDLLTLSACDTAIGGSDANGKEIESFAMLAQRKGARSVIATLWPVADRSTRELMEVFYRSRLETAPGSKADALQFAQLRLLRGAASASGKRSPSRGLTKAAPRKGVEGVPPYAHPYFWAPFLLIGNGR
jgi:CHAT domain-containing protein/tetratricopeptide (TPR) repeat protein